MIRYGNNLYSVERVHCCHGSRTIPTYAAHYDEAGRLLVESDGTHDLYADIQSHAESVDINVILARYAAGDSSALEKVQTQYMDVTEMPKTYAEMLNCTIAAEQYFYSLPPEVREQFNNSVTEYLAAVLQAAERPQPVESAEEPTSESEVTPDDAKH